MLVMMLKNHENLKNINDCLSLTKENNEKDPLEFDDSAAMAVLKQMSTTSYAAKMGACQI